MSTGVISKLSIFDTVAKIIPGSEFLIGIIISIPKYGVMQDLFTQAGLLIALAGIPIAYISGVILQGISGNAFPRKKKFQKRMRDVRENTEINKNNLEIEGGGKTIDALVWTDAIVRFQLNSSYFEPSSNEYEERDYEAPVSYLIFCKSLLYVSKIFSSINKSDLDRTRRHYGAEDEVFDLVDKYVSVNEIGDVSRFRSLYVMQRSLTMCSCILFHIFVSSTILSYVIGTPSQAGLYITAVSSLLCLLSIPPLYSGTLVYDDIRDDHIIRSYYTSIIEDTNVSYSESPNV